MQHVFVINEYAGKGGSAAAIRRELQALDGQISYTVYCTKNPTDATAFVRAYCAEHTEPVRFYACGGDGTLQEVAEGLLGYPHASMTAYACGSGNDFVKYYGGRERFLDIAALTEAPERPIDIITLSDGHHAVNACHFGFDSAVAATMNAVRHHKIFGGKRAYPTGVLKALFCNMSTRCTVTVDGEVLNPKGELLLCTVANGQYVGGSYRCAPRSRNDDGLLEVCLVKPISRLTFVRLMNAYKEGKHLDDPRFEKFVLYRQGKTVEVSSPDRDFACSLDGEILFNPQFTVTVAEKAVRFAVPAKESVPVEGSESVFRK